VTCICGNYSIIEPHFHLIEASEDRKQSSATFWKVMYIQTQCSLQEAFCFCGRCFSILGRSLL